MKPFLYIRLTQKEKDTIEDAIEIMNYNNSTDMTMNDVVRSKMVTWAKRYLRNN